MKEKAIIREQKQGYNTHYKLIIKKSVKDVKAKSMKSCNVRTHACAYASTRVDGHARRAKVST